MRILIIILMALPIVAVSQGMTNPTAQDLISGGELVMQRSNGQSIEIMDAPVVHVLIAEPIDYTGVVENYPDWYSVIQKTIKYSIGELYASQPNDKTFHHFRLHSMYMPEGEEPLVIIQVAIMKLEITHGGRSKWPRTFYSIDKNQDSYITSVRSAGFTRKIAIHAEISVINASDCSLISKRAEYAEMEDDNMRFRIEGSPAVLPFALRNRYAPRELKSENDLVIETLMKLIGQAIFRSHGFYMIPTISHREQHAINKRSTKN